MLTVSGSDAPPRGMLYYSYEGTMRCGHCLQRTGHKYPAYNSTLLMFSEYAHLLWTHRFLSTELARERAYGRDLAPPTLAEETTPNTSPQWPSIKANLDWQRDYVEDLQRSILEVERAIQKEEARKREEGLMAQMKYLKASCNKLKYLLQTGRSTPAVRKKLTSLQDDFMPLYLRFCELIAQQEDTTEILRCGGRR
ncbi:hypothetical protein B0H19DRAFT_480167 [Mycena capillaripes]|nr:hypothetical protein B0H19DRAFT_480167 [Mycena capillaripes]